MEAAVVRATWTDERLDRFDAVDQRLERLEREMVAQAGRIDDLFRTLVQSAIVVAIATIFATVAALIGLLFTLI